MTGDGDQTKAFVAWAGQDLERWKKAEGQTAVSVHKNRGHGTIVGVGSRHGSIVVCMRYGSGPLVNVSGVDFARVHSQLTIPTGLETEMATCVPKAVRRSIPKPSPLARAVGTQQTASASRVSRLKAKAAEGAKLEPEEIRLLGESGEAAALEEYLEAQQQRGNYAHESEVCSFWRKAGLQGRALAATSYLETRQEWPARDKYAWTCRAAAFADTYDEDRATESLDRAARCAESALRCDKRNIYTYHCMGRIRALQGDYEEADHCFRLAEEFAGEEMAKAQASQLEGLARSLKKAEPSVAAEAIGRLLKLDPVRYKPLLSLLPADLQQKLRSHPPDG